MTLSPKQQRFVDEYLIDLNATKAAVRAGYSEASASSYGTRLRQTPEIAEAIATALAARAQRTEITQDQVVQELARLAFANMADYMRINEDGDPYLDLSQLNRDHAAAITEATVEDFLSGRGKDAREVRRVKIKLADKRGPLVDLGKHLGMFRDKVELSGPDGSPVILIRKIVDPQDP
ncbi:MAG: terminase small subunit [Rhodospirillaceae bacterium]